MSNYVNGQYAKRVLAAWAEHKPKIRCRPVPKGAVFMTIGPCDPITTEFVIDYWDHHSGMYSEVDRRYSLDQAVDEVHAAWRRWTKLAEESK